MKIGPSKRDVSKLEDVLNTNKTISEPQTDKNDGKDKKVHWNKKPDLPVIPRGRPKSGRIWKSEKTKFSSIIKTRGIRNSFKKKQALREELKRVKETSRAILAARQEEKERRKQRRRENLKRKEENRKKSEVVQVIKNTSKIKRMKKKQLRTIEKRDTNNLV